MDQLGQSPDPDPMAMRRRIVRLERVARSLAQLDFAKLEGAVRAAEEQESVWSPLDRFWFSGVAGVSLPRPVDREVRPMWTRVLIGLAASLAGKELDPHFDDSLSDGPSDLSYGLSEGLDIQSVEGEATTLLERSVSGDVWLATIGLWNAFCAALLRDHIPEPLRVSLEAPWRIALGSTPWELISARRRD